MLLFFFNDTATTEIYTLSLHDALPISLQARPLAAAVSGEARRARAGRAGRALHLGGCGRHGAIGLPAGGLRAQPRRSEEHTSELQSRLHLVCRLLLEKKNQ